MTTVATDTMPAPDIGRRRAWIAISVATIPATVSFWAILYAFVTEAVEGGATPAAAAALGLAVGPFTFLALAAISSRSHLPMTVLGSTMMAFGVALPVLAVWPDVATGLVAGFGAGATVALRRAGTATYGRRAAFVAGATVLEAVLVVAIPPLALASAPALPFVAVGLADETATHRHGETAGRP